MASQSQIEKFRRFAWFTLGFCVFVILWGAYVRASGSGAGCGNHWPLCNGEVLPHPARIQTWIEFIHRISSGVSLGLIFILAVWSHRIFAPRSFARRAAALALLAILIEAGVGAMLVLLRYVEFDQSLGRVISIAIHLTNTLFLLGSLAILADSAGLPNVRWRIPILRERRIFRLILSGFVVLGALGAITALGDTLFHPGSFAAGWAAKWAANAHITERIRLYHPLVALLWLALVVPWMLRLKDILPESSKRVNFFLACLGINFILGPINVLLLAPVWLQILHLFVADMVWISLILVGRFAATRWHS